MSQTAVKFRDVEDFLAWERRQAERWEWDGAEAVAMTGGTLAHSIIAGNASRSFDSLAARGCQPFQEGAKVRAGRGIFYPDVVVTCSPLDTSSDTVPNPIVIVEVLSESSANYDRGLKWAQYQTLPSLQHYLMVWQQEIRVEHFWRDGTTWRYQSLTDANAVLRLDSLGLDLALAAIYRNAEPAAA